MMEEILILNKDIALRKAEKQEFLDFLLTLLFLNSEERF